MCAQRSYPQCSNFDQPLCKLFCSESLASQNSTQNVSVPLKFRCCSRETLATLARNTVLLPRDIAKLKFSQDMLQRAKINHGGSVPQGFSQHSRISRAAARAWHRFNMPENKGRKQYKKHARLNVVPSFWLLKTNSEFRPTFRRCV